VFSNGKTPYKDSLLPEVIEKIRNGELLPQLPNDVCPDEIYEKLIATCFVNDASARPSFKELYDQAVYLGAFEDEEAVKEHHNEAHNNLTSDLASLTQTEVLERQGPSVHHLNTDFITNTLKEVSNQMSKMIGITEPAEANIHHMIQAYGKPAGLIVTCPRDGEPGAAYVDILSGEDHVGIANALLSYSWGYKVKFGIMIVYGYSGCSH
jgi:hypothetical protein